MILMVHLSVVGRFLRIAFTLLQEQSQYNYTEKLRMRLFSILYEYTANHKSSDIRNLMILLAFRDFQKSDLSLFFKLARPARSEELSCGNRHARQFT